MKRNSNEGGEGEKEKKDLTRGFERGREDGWIKLEGCIEVKQNSDSLANWKSSS